SEEQLDADRCARLLGTDNLTDVGQHMVFHDIPTVWLPGEFRADRGRALEAAWKKNWDEVLDVAFRKLAPGEAAGWRPSLLPPPRLVEAGRQLLISNLILSSLTDNIGPLLNTDSGPGTPRSRPAAKRRPASGDPSPLDRQRYSLSALEFFQLFPGAWAFKVSTAARMNASFPFVSPAVDLPTQPRRRVVDAGYYDNYGVNLAARWLAQHADWLQQETAGVVLIQIRDSVSDLRLFADKPARSWSLASGLEWLSGPLTGAASAREAQMTFNNDALLEALSNRLNVDDPDFFT